MAKRNPPAGAKPARAKTSPKAKPRPAGAEAPRAPGPGRLSPGDAPALPRLRTAGGWQEVFSGAGKAALEAALPAYLMGRRWFGGKARDLVSVEILDAVPVPTTAGEARFLLSRAVYREGEAELYALPVAFATGARAGELRRSSPQAELPELQAGAALGLLYAADKEPAFARALLEAMDAGKSFPGAGGKLVAWSTAALRSRIQAVRSVDPVPMAAEQSNTSIRFGESVILKLFRKTEPGSNPDLEVGAFLSGEVGFAHTPTLLGGIEYRPLSGEPVALAIAQDFVRSEGDAWAFTLRELERARASGDGSGYAAAAALLGRRTAELHLALASRTAPPDFEPEPFDGRSAGELHRGVRELAERNLALLERRLARLPEATRAVASEVLARRSEILARIDRIRDRPLTGLRTRTHGDYHLGQVLRTVDDFVIIDFEGEPARPLAERRAKRSPLRDVAGMIRSFHYAANAGLLSGGASPDAAAEAWSERWYRDTARAFLQGYLETAQGSAFLPGEDERGELLALFLLEKAVYELAYELNNRPGWVKLPLRGILELLDAGAAEAAPDGTGTEDARMAPTKPTKAGAPKPEGEERAVQRTAPPPRDGVSQQTGPTELDLHLWSEGTHYRAYRSLGSHLTEVDGQPGVSFAVWAPNAATVSVVGDFNGWNRGSHPLRPLGPSGVWHGFVPGVGKGTTYKYFIASRLGGFTVEKADPFAVRQETPPRTGSVVWDLDYAWNDAVWMRDRAGKNGLRSPMSIYEVHLGSWRRVPEEGNRSLRYREIAAPLADYCVDMGFTHVELLPITEHPFYGSWGYQTTGYFAPTSRYGTPQDFAYLVDTLHQRGIGVILDWVPSHFPTDEHGLAYFDGTHLFEHADPRQGIHKDWDSYIFNYGRNEVRSFLLSSALFWLDAFHIDGLRVDAVASMLYLDYSRKEGEWVPNEHGGRENLEAVAFLRKMNEVVYAEYPDAQTIAEESTSWPMVSRPNYLGGLGFGMKWDMGWMHDTLRYFAGDPVFRRYHHHELTFRMMYAFTENFVLSLSHDEVVHGKGSLLGKMWGDERQKLAGLRLLYADMWGQPGKKLLFMGCELGQGQEWSHERSLDWHLLGSPGHEGLRSWVRDLNRLMCSEPALHARDFDGGGFEWVDANDAETSVLTWLRRAGAEGPDILVVLNLTPVPRMNYRVGVPSGGYWREVLNSDAPEYGGQGWGNFGGQEAAPVSVHGRRFSLVLTVPPLGALFLRADA